MSLVSGSHQVRFPELQRYAVRNPVVIFVEARDGCAAPFARFRFLRILDPATLAPVRREIAVIDAWLVMN
jgi:hypothetical protein